MKLAILLLLTFPLLATTCIRSKYRIHIYNHSAENVYVIPNYNFPDTSLAGFSKEVLFANDSTHYVAAYYRKPVFYLELCRKEEWRRVIKTDSLQVLVIAEKVMKQMSTEEIIAKRPFKTQIVVSYADILLSNCLLTIN